MHTCELFSLRKSKEDFDTLQADFDRVVELLGEQGVDIRFKTDVSADPKKISDAIGSSLAEGSVQLYLFANALNTSDSSSFKSLFYEFITAQELGLTVDEEHAGCVPKIKVCTLGDLGNGYKGYCFRHRDKVFVAVPYASLTGKDIADLLCEATAKAADVLTASREEFPDGIVYLSGADAKKKKRKRKESYLMSYIPHKGDSGMDVTRKVIVLIAIAAFVVSAVYLISFLIAGNNSEADILEIQQAAHGTGDASSDEASPDGELSAENWSALQKINKEIVGWITLPGTYIDYPVLYHKGDDQSYQYYLSHNYKNEYDDYGSIFVDYRSKQGTKSKNVILHGHNISIPKGAMFHELLNYSDGFSPKLNYFKNHAVITFNTPDGDSKWKVISVIKTNTLFNQGEFFNYMQGTFNSDAEFMNFVYNVRMRSMFNIPTMVNEDDQLLTLSTCSYEYKNFRTVVVARKVRPGEDDSSADAQLATVNPSPLYPEVYYGGGYRPDIGTFRSAYNSGRIDWYDGKGDLEGSEDLTDTISANASRATSADGTPIAGYTYYFVTYRNLDKKQIAAYTVREGDPVPVPDVKPSYEDENYTYTFVKWNRNVQGVNFNALNTSVTIYPIYDAKPKSKPTEPEPEPDPETEPVTEYDDSGDFEQDDVDDIDDYDDENHGDSDD